MTEGRGMVQEHEVEEAVNEEGRWLLSLLCAG